MLSTLTGAGGLLDRRFFLHALLPSLFFCALLVLLPAAAPHGLAAAARTWNSKPGAVQAWLSCVFAAVVLCVAGALSSSREVVIACFAGHWVTAPGRRLAAACSLRHQRLLDEAANELTAIANASYASGPAPAPAAALRAASAERTLSRYPPPTRPEHVAPTRLGNVLKGAELYARLRYSIDAAVIWPRLYQVLPDKLTDLITSARAKLDLLLGISVLALIFAPFSVAALAIAGTDWLLPVICAPFAGLISYATYNLAVGSAENYGALIRVAFDLHRNDLRTLLGEAAGNNETADQEADYWDRLGRFWHRALPRDTDVNRTPSSRLP